MERSFCGDGWLSPFGGTVDWSAPCLPEMDVGKVTVFLLVLLLATVSWRFDSPYLLSDPLRLAAGILLAVAAGPLSRRPTVRRLGARIWQIARRNSRSGVPLLAVLVFGTTCVLSHLVLDPIPHISDEVSYLFQARVLAAGRLTLPAPPIPSLFPAEWVVVHDGKWFSVFPPGWPLLLSLGVRLGIPSLVNPVLGAMSLVAIHRLAIRFVGDTRAVAVAILCAVSPFFLFMCASFMSHPASLLFATLCLLFLLEATTRGNWSLFLLSGGFAAFGFLVRPLDATVLWAVPALYLLVRQRTWMQLLGTSLSAAALAIGATLYFAYNHSLTGQSFMPLLNLTSPHNRFGFGPDIGLPWAGFATPGHDLGKAAANLSLNVAVMSADLFGWPLCSLWLVLLLVCFGKLDWQHRLAALAIIGVVSGYAFYWYHGVCFGARFYFAVLPLLLILTVEGLSRAPAIFASVLGGSADDFVAPLRTFVALAFAFSVLVYLPTVSLFAPYHNQRNVDRGLDRFVAARDITQGIVFIGPGAWDYGRALLLNALSPTGGPVIYAFEAGASDQQQLVHAFPDRPVFHYRQDDCARPLPPALKRVLYGWSVREILRRLVSYPSATLGSPQL
jgi:hypothetical protein